MKIVIDIPEEVKQKIDENLDSCDLDIYDCVMLATKNGTPLPKGHGRIGDLDKIKKEMQNYYDYCAETSEYTRLGFETAMAVVEDAQIIIEAESEEEE